MLAEIEGLIFRGLIKVDGEPYAAEGGYRSPGVFPRPLLGPLSIGCPSRFRPPPELGSCSSLLSPMESTKDSARRLLTGYQGYFAFKSVGKTHPNN